MATSDRFPDYYKCPCECGKGQIVIDMTEPDYPGARLWNRNYYPRWECEDCSKTYSVEAEGSDIVVRAQDGEKDWIGRLPEIRKIDMRQIK